MKANKVIINNIEFDQRADQKVIEFILNNIGKKEKRFRFDFGDVSTGQSWGEINDIEGYIGQSTGNVKLPLLVYNKRSLGGGALLDGCIVKISECKGGKVLYQHPNYKPAK